MATNHPERYSQVAVKPLLLVTKILLPAIVIFEFITRRTCVKLDRIGFKYEDCYGKEVWRMRKDLSDDEIIANWKKVGVI